MAHTNYLLTAKWRTIYQLVWDILGPDPQCELVPSTHSSLRKMEMHHSTYDELKDILLANLKSSLQSLGYWICDLQQLCYCSLKQHTSLARPPLGSTPDQVRTFITWLSVYQLSCSAPFVCTRVTWRATLHQITTPKNWTLIKRWLEAL